MCGPVLINRIMPLRIVHGFIVPLLQSSRNVTAWQVELFLCYANEHSGRYSTGAPR
jgi:hypothetical protein